MQVHLRHGNAVGKCAVVIEDAEHGAVGAMRLQAGLAGGAGLARAIDLAHDATPLERTRFGNADELVAEDAAEPHVALDQLQVGLADARLEDAHQHLARLRHGVGAGVLVDRLILENDRAHGWERTTLVGGSEGPPYV